MSGQHQWSHEVTEHSDSTDLGIVVDSNLGFSHCIQHGHVEDCPSSLERSPSRRAAARSEGYGGTHRWAGESSNRQAGLWFKTLMKDLR
jgi:hypothetical protein